MRMRTRLWRGCAVAGLVPALTLLLVGCGGQRVRQHTEQGNTYLRLGKIQDAYNEFQQALTDDNPDGWLGMARCLRAMNKPQEALEHYEKVISLTPNRPEAYAEATAVALQRGDVGAEERESQAVDFAERFEAVNTELGGVLHAYVLRKTGRLNEAIAKLEELRESHASSLDVRLALAGAYMEAGRAADAEKEAQSALEDIDAESLPARMVLIEAYQQQGKAEEVEAELRALVEARPEDDNMKLALARSLLNVGKVDDAEELATPILDKVPDSPWANYVVGACLLEQGDFSEAVQCLQIASQALPNYGDVARKLALAKRGGRPLEEEEAAPARTQDAGGTQWHKLWTRGELGELLQGRQAYLTRDGRDAAEVLLLAAIFTGNKRAAAEVAGEAPADSPVTLYYRKLNERNMKDLLDFVQQWEETDPERQIMRDNAVAFAQSLGGMRMAAVRTYAHCFEAHPDNGVALFNLANLYRGLNMPRQAARCLQRLAAIHPDNAEARTMLFATLLQADLLDEARQAAESTYVAYPESPRALANLALIYRRTGDPELAMEVLRKGLENTPDDATVRVALGEALLHEGKPAEAADAVGDGPFPDGIAARATALRAFCAAAQGKWEEVAAALDADDSAPLKAAAALRGAALVKAGKNADALAFLGGAGDDPGKAPKLAIALNALGASDVRLEGESLGFAQALSGNDDALGSFLYALSCDGIGYYSGAVRALQEVDEAVPGNPVVLELIYADIVRLVKEGDSRDGEWPSLAARITQEYSEVPAAWLGMADVAKKLGLAEEEGAAIRKAAELAPNNPAVLWRTAVWAEQQGDTEATVAAYRKLAEETPDSPFVKNNLAYMILDTGGDVEEALALASAAVAKVQFDPRLLHTLGLAQLKHGDLEKSEKNLRMALELSPGQPTLLLDYGQLLIAKGDTEAGKEQVELALRYADSLGLDFPRRDEAEKIGGAE